MSIKLSKRAESITPSQTLAITAKAKAMKAEGHDVVSFGAGEPDFDTPQAIKDAAIKSIQDGFTKYTPAGGTVEMKKAVANLYQKKGFNLTTDNIVINCGAKHSLYNIFQVILDPGDEVIIFSPYWVSYPEMIKLAGGLPVVIETTAESNFIPEPSKIVKSITSKTRAIIINSPSNPSGSIIPKETIIEISKIAADNDLVIISDEIYDQIVFEKDIFYSPAYIDDITQARTIIVNGVSKSYAMTGWRIGYTIGDPVMIKKINALQSHSTSNPASISQAAALEALTMEIPAEMLQAFQDRCDYIYDELKSIEGILVQKPQGAFYIFPKISAFYGKTYNGKKISNSLDFADALLESKLTAVVPGVAFGADDCIRLSYATSMDNIKKGLLRIKEFLAELK